MKHPIIPNKPFKYAKIAGGKVCRPFPKNLQVHPSFVNGVQIWSPLHHTSFRANNPQSKFVWRELAGIMLEGRLCLLDIQCDFHCSLKCKIIFFAIAAHKVATTMRWQIIQFLFYLST